MKNKQMYEISLILFYSFFFFFLGGGGGGGIDDYFANFARDSSLNAVVMSKMSNFTIGGVVFPEIKTGLSLCILLMQYMVIQVVIWVYFLSR